MNSIANLRRPSFLSGSIVISEKPQVKPLKKTIFRRFNNNDIVRPSFKQTAPRARHGISEDRLRMIDVSQHGTKVQLSEKALEKLSVMVKDETDKAWLKEKQRRLDLGETIADLINKPPLGRPQREKEARVDIGSELLPLQNNLTLIESAINNDDYKDKPEDLESIIYNVVDNEYKNKKAISDRNLNRIRKITDRLRFRAKLFDSQVNLAKFNESPSKVIMHLITRDRVFDPKQVLIDEDDLSAVSINEILLLLRQGRVIDLQKEYVESLSTTTKSLSSSSSSTSTSLGTPAKTITF